MRKKLNISIQACEEKFNFDCCATLAISSFFQINRAAMQALCVVLGYKKWYEGLTFNQIKKLVNLLDYRGTIRYIPNTASITYEQLVDLFREEILLVMFDEHLSYVKSGIIYDTHLMADWVKEDWLKAKPTGWWKL